MAEPVNIESLRVVAEKLREAEAPYKAAGDPRGLGIGAMALVVENSADELEELRRTLRDREGEIAYLKSEE